MDTTVVFEALFNIGKLCAMAQRAIERGDNTQCRALLDSIDLYIADARKEMATLNELPR